MWAKLLTSAFQKACLSLPVILIIGGCTNLSGVTNANVGNTPGLVDSKKLPIAASKTKAANNAKHINIPLQCHKNILTPALFRTVTRRLKSFEGSPEYVNTPATIVWSNVRFQVAPARFPIETTPATYREMTETITVLKSRSEVIGQPADYKIINKPVTTQESYIAWKPDCVSDEPQQCIIRMPAKTQIIKQHIVDIPARMTQIARPAKTFKLKRKILVSPGKGHGEPIPAQYETVRIGRVSKVWRAIAKPRPDRFTNIPIQVKIRPERIRRTPVLCYEQAERTDLIKIQQGLQQKGYRVTISGRPDKQTLKAIIRFQQDNQLPTGAISIETLRKLKLN